MCKTFTLIFKSSNNMYILGLLYKTILCFFLFIHDCLIVPLLRLEKQIKQIKYVCCVKWQHDYTVRRGTLYHTVWFMMYN